jgi:hypothetical protein
VVVLQVDDPCAVPVNVMNILTNVNKVAWWNWLTMGTATGTSINLNSYFHNPQKP